jgi:hypothetical protein
MIWQNDNFLLADHVKLFYTVSASPLNFIKNPVGSKILLEG